MDPLTHVRLRARDAHRRAFALCGNRSSLAIIEAALRQRDIEVADFEPGTRFAPGVLGVYERIGRLISVDATLPPGLRERVIAHEIGHHDLHDDLVEEVSTPDIDAGGEPQAAGYSRRERREIEAETFAAEFLCPGDWLHGEIVTRGRHPDEVAAGLGMPGNFVAERSVRVLCLPPLEDAPRRRGPPPALTEAQLRAATWDNGPLLVNAGPGTGKTTVLARRVEHLLDSGVDASSILVLTFSARATSEVRRRVDEIPGSAGGIWVGTIHGFGSEVVHGWHDRLGRGSRLRIVDRISAAELLEEGLDGLPERYRDRSGHPAASFAPLLRAIGRCKAAMVTADRYAAAARAADLDGSMEGCPAEDFALAFAAYQGILRRNGAIDLDDLVHVAALLFEQHDEIAIHYGRRFSHVLLDEAQDLDPAATRLLRSLCGPGTCLWAVGDPDQCIHRFRGATPGTMADFPELFGGRVVTLTENFRSGPEIAAACGRFAPRADADEAIAVEISGAGPGHPVRISAAPDLDGEIDHVEGEVTRLDALGIPLRDQAVLARTHRALGRLAEGLSLRGVPVLHIGDLLARDDVKDMLAVLGVACRGEPSSLLRLAAGPRLAVPRTDVLAVVRKAATERVPALDLLRRPRPAPGVSPSSAASLARLAEAIDEVSRSADAGAGADAASILARCLFGDFPTPLGQRDEIGRLAVFALIRFARETRMDPERFLSKVRRAVALDAGRDLGAITAEMECDGLLKLLTIHDAKGLEFDAVHLPMVTAGHMPLARKTDRFPSLPGLADLSLDASEHGDEERALFFVAMSRARHHLSLSWSRRCGERRGLKPSSFLKEIAPFHDGKSEGCDRARSACAPSGAADNHPKPRRGPHHLAALETYAACPARYRFEHVDGLAAAARPDAPERAQAAALSALRELDGLGEEEPSIDEVDSVFRMAWHEAGLPADSGDAGLRDSARLFVERMAGVPADEAHSFRASPTWRIAIKGATVIIVPERVIVHPYEKAVVQILASRDGRAGPIAWRAALTLIAARGALPGMRVRAEALDFDRAERFDIEAADEHAAIDRYGAIIDGIDRGDLHPVRSPQACSACPFFVACGA